MARPIRMEYDGAVYHVTLRGNHRCDIFQSDGDREHFLLTLAESLHRSQTTWRTDGVLELVRPVAARALCDQGRLTQREAADVLNVTRGGAVSKQLGLARG